MKLSDILVKCAVILIALSFPTSLMAHDHRLANADWYKRQTINEDARLRMPSHR